MIATAQKRERPVSHGVRRSLDNLAKGAQKEHARPYSQAGSRRNATVTTTRTSERATPRNVFLLGAMAPSKERGVDPQRVGWRRRQWTTQFGLDRAELKSAPLTT